MSSRDQNPPGKEQKQAKKQPTHTAYFIENKEDATKPNWIKVGVAWEHADQQGLNLFLTNLGQTVKLTVRKNLQQPMP